MSGEFCSKTTEFEELDVKLLFMIDMSASNISPDSDREGARFDLIEQLLQDASSEDSCFKGADVEVAIIGFATQIIGGVSSSICRANRFVDPQTALQHLDELRTLHNQTVQDGNEGRQPQSGVARTNYINAMDCLSNTITDDLPVGNKSSSLYSSFFLTDGAPTDELTTDQLRLNLKNSIEAMRNQVVQRAFGVSVQPVLYGYLSLDDGQNEEEKVKAKSILNAIAEAGRTLLKSVANVEQIDFCGLVNAGSNRRYKVKRFGAINLTAKAVGNRLIPDSDMDGLADEEESLMGFDPQKARSKYPVLDGICKSGICNSDIKVQDCLGVNEVGLSKCDVDRLNLTDGLDSDKDLIPDFIEILKGTDATDINENFRNSDNDSLQNYAEILQGSDPLSYNSSYNKDLLMDYSVQLMPMPMPGCEQPQESWVYSIDNVPLVETLETKNTDVFSLSHAPMNHAAQENVIFVYYIVVEEMESGEEFESQYLYGQYLKMKPGEPAPMVKDFKLLGKIDSTFRLVGE